MAYLGLLELLPRLYGDIIIPPAVAHELAYPPGGAVTVDAKEMAFLQVRSPADIAGVKTLRLELDDGEAEAIALASELSAVLLIDEADGRAAAIALGVRVTGVVGILLAAKKSLLVAAIRPLLDRLRAEGRFFLSDKFYLHTLKLAREQE